MDFDSDQRRQINRNSRNARDRFQDRLFTTLRDIPLDDAQMLLEAIRADAMPSDLDALIDQLQPKKTAMDMDRVDGVQPDGAIEDGANSVPDLADDWNHTPTESEKPLPFGQHNDATTSDGTAWSRRTSIAAKILQSDRSDMRPETQNTVFNQSSRFQQVVLSFREAARLQIIDGASPIIVLSMSKLDISLLFRDRLSSDPHTVSTWACELAKSCTTMSLAAKLALVYLAGSFMRWLTMPCQATYALMSKLLRPFAVEAVSHSPVEVEVCREHALKWLLRSMTNENKHVWPFNEADCFLTSTDAHPYYLSDFFMQHCDNIRNWETTPVHLPSSS